MAIIKIFQKDEAAQLNNYLFDVEYYFRTRIFNIMRNHLIFLIKIKITIFYQ